MYRFELTEWRHRIVARADGVKRRPEAEWSHLRRPKADFELLPVKTPANTSCAPSSQSCSLVCTLMTKVEEFQDRERIS